MGISFSETGRGKKIQLIDISQNLKAVLSDSEVQKLIGEWEVVWGPAVYQHHGERLNSEVADDTMYIAKSKDNGESDRYVIAIAGTNPNSLYGIIVQDFWVNKTTPWNNGQPWKATSEKQTPDIRVSAGTSRGVEILCEEMQSDKKSLLDYLKNLTSSASKPISITIAGHSLGGALSPTLALSLMDRRSEWDSQSNVSLSVLPSAGPTPGNAEFASYYDSKLGEVTDRIWNQIDFVPHGWQQDLLEQSRSLYEPNIQPTALINLFIDFCKFLSRDGNYQQICQNQDAFKSSYYSPSLSKNALSDLSIDDLSKLVAKLILHHLGYENLAKSSTDKVPQIIASLIEELIQNSESGKTISNQTEVEPYVEKIIAELQSEKSGLNINELKNILILLLSSLLDFIKYFLQLGYQHLYPYCEYLQVSEFMKRMKTITGS